MIILNDELRLKSDYFGTNAALRDKRKGTRFLVAHLEAKSVSIVELNKSDEMVSGEIQVSNNDLARYFTKASLLESHV